MANPQTTLDVRTLGGIFGRANLAGAGGAVPVNGQTQVFLDQLNGNVNSNITQTQADSNFFDGITPNGEVFTIFGMQIQIWEESISTPATPVFPQCIATNAVVTAQALRDLSFSLSLKGQEYQIGSLKTVPCPLGGNTYNQNGGRAVAPFRFPRQLPLQLNSNDQFFVTVTAKRAIATSGGTNGFGIFIYCPASRGIPLGQLSGA
jgi:hypothetical protein